MKFRRRHRCKECPFAKGAVKGWLGPWTAKEMIEVVHSEAGLYCHMSGDALAKKGVGGEEGLERAHVCVGSLQHATKSFKFYRPGNPLQAMQDKVPADPNGVMDRWEFMEHHAGVCDPRRKK